MAFEQSTVHLGARRQLALPDLGQQVVNLEAALAQPAAGAQVRV
jgi:hypothetical protein